MEFNTFFRGISNSLAAQRKLVAASVFLSMIVFGLPLAWMMASDYKATSQLYIEQPYSDYEQLIANEKNRDPQMIDAYAALAKSETVLREAIIELDLAYTVSELHEKIEVSFAEVPDMVRITVLSHDPVQAEAIANVLAFTASEEIKSELKAENAVAIPAPSSSGVDYSNGQLLLACLAAAALIGFVIGVLLAVIREMAAGAWKAHSRKGRAANQGLQTVFK